MSELTKEGTEERHREHRATIFRFPFSNFNFPKMPYTIAG